MSKRSLTSDDDGFDECWDADEDDRDYRDWGRQRASIKPRHKKTRNTEGEPNGTEDPQDRRR